MDRAQSSEGVGRGSTDTHPGQGPHGKAAWRGTASLSDRSWPPSSDPRPSRGTGDPRLTVQQSNTHTHR